MSADQARAAAVAAVLGREFERCRPWIEATLAVEDHTETAAEVRAMVLDGRAQIWPGPDAVVMTQVSRDGPETVLTFWFIGGALKGALALIPRIEADARRLGCTEVRCAPYRRAWRRIGPLMGFLELRPGIFAKDL